jgi:hypothetical protein
MVGATIIATIVISTINKMTIIREDARDVTRHHEGGSACASAVTFIVPFDCKGW